MWSTAGRPEQELAQQHADTVVPAPLDETFAFFRMRRTWGA
jgi:hypothetical protein